LAVQHRSAGAVGNLRLSVFENRSWTGAHCAWIGVLVEALASIASTADTAGLRFLDFYACMEFHSVLVEA
jgi:hypothetical protein